MNFIHKLRNFSTFKNYNQTFKLTAQLFRQTKTIESEKSDVIQNIRDKFRCNYYEATLVYNNFPLLRSADAIKGDSLELLRNYVSNQLLIEYPKLVTIEAGKCKT